MSTAIPSLRRYERASRLFNSFAVGATAATQTQAGQILELMGLSTQRKVPLFRQAVAATKSRNWYEGQAAWMRFWLSAFRLAQSNTAAVLQIHTQAWQAWLRMLSSRYDRR